MSDRWLRRAYSILERHLGESVVTDRPLAKETTLRIGGPAAVFATADTFHNLRVVFETVVDYDLPWFVLGKGSNLLISDAGFDGVVVRLGRDFRRIEVSGSEIRAGGAMPLSMLVQAALKHALGGLAFAIGIPGTLGGGIAGNAGAHGGCLGDIVRSATVFLSKGELRSIDKSEMTFGYRESSLGQDEIIVEVSLGLRPADIDLVQMDMERFFRQRKETQPLHHPSAGSTFKNPPGDSAGRLIEEAGCKGLSIGGAKVSEQHANFIINTGGATALDIYALMLKVRRRVEEASGVLLEPEIRLLGAFSEELMETDHAR
ncbi:MAG: UDP-N-acetylmuramate dehydrogenase [Chloroflexi bacterium]|nr:UDP-N-acetylmuramate dehydrogenase [Chloroflexota bacterium]